MKRRHQMNYNFPAICEKNRWLGKVVHKRSISLLRDKLFLECNNRYPSAIGLSFCCFERQVELAKQHCYRRNRYWAGRPSSILSPTLVLHMILWKTPTILRHNTLRRLTSRNNLNLWYPVLGIANSIVSPSLLLTYGAWRYWKKTMLLAFYGKSEGRSYLCGDSIPLQIPFSPSKCNNRFHFQRWILLTADFASYIRDYARKVIFMFYSWLTQVAFSSQQRD